MTDATSVDRLVDALDTEFRELVAEIRLRLDLQHRNMNVFVVLVTAISGYLIKFASDHGVTGAPSSLVRNEIVLLVPLVTVIANVFLWRHLDHDLNIIDKAAYIHSRIRPALVGATDSDMPLAFERFLHDRRKKSTVPLSAVRVVGQESVPLFLLLAAYLAGGWYTQTSVQGHAGHAGTAFVWLLGVGSGASAVSLLLAIAIGHAYDTVGAPDIPTAISKGETAASGSLPESAAVASASPPASPNAARRAEEAPPPPRRRKASPPE